MPIYDSLYRIVSKTTVEAEIRNLRDRFDAQSVIWVVRSGNDETEIESRDGSQMVACLLDWPIYQAEAGYVGVVAAWVALTTPA